MKHRWKVYLIVAFGLLGVATLVAVGAGAGLSLVFDDECANQQVGEYPSPDRTMRIVVFQRDCGATTGFSTQASLLPIAKSLGDTAGNLFIADTGHGGAPSATWGGPELDVRWSSPDALTLEHDPRARVFRAEKRLHGVDISYSMKR